MREINYKNDSIAVEGIYGFEKHKTLRRYTDGIIEAYPRLAEFDRRCNGVRMRFRTDSAKVRIDMKVSNVFVDRGMSFYQANVGYAFIGDYSHSRFMGLLTAEDSYESDTLSIEFDNCGENDITVFCPRNSYVDDMTVYIDDEAKICRPSAHRTELPFVFYGSSITEQGHTSVPNAYASLLSRFFDADFYNFGASGNARGEEEIAEHLARIPKSIFFYDYDHNAPDAQSLKDTHENFFKVFRKYDSDTPVIMTSRPANDTPDFYEREAIVRNTYENAKKSGDKNVYFIEGSRLFGDTDPAICTTDRTHPNDLGHFLIAKCLSDFIEKNGLIGKK